MSQEKVEIVRAAGEAFNRHDADALARLSDPDLEFVSTLTAVDAAGATYRGPGGWADYFAAMEEMWAEWELEDLKIFDANDDRVAAIFRLVGTGKQSGARVGHTIGLAYRIRDGKLWRMRSYLNPEDALEAAGLFR